MTMKKLLILPLICLGLAFALTQCDNTPKGYTLKGAIKDAANLDISLDQVFFNPNTTPIATTKADGSGNFTLVSQNPFPQGLFRLSVGAKKTYFMLDGTEKAIDVKGDLATMEKLDLAISGSETFTCYSNIVKDLYANPVKTPEDAKARIGKACNPLMRAFFVSSMFAKNAPGFLGDFRDANKALADYMPSSPYSVDYATMVANIERQVAGMEDHLKQPDELDGPIKLGEAAPEIALKDPSGKVRSLSSLKGKIVLLDFWASWCGPCRQANPHVVETYNKYKDKGFTVYSVSLDGVDPRTASNMTPDQLTKQEDAAHTKWMNAIKQDGLVWENHVSDLKHWGSAAAATYGVHSIPSTFLLDRKGNIVAINPRTNLEQELLKVL